MKKKVYEVNDELLIQMLDDYAQELKSNYITIHDARRRDYIVRTKYYGKIKDENIKKDFKEEIEKEINNTFSGVCNDILNYNFVFIGKKTNLDIYYHVLEQYECKQIVLDMYK